MIISKTPLRVSFCGGGSDIPSFYSKHGGCVLSTAIDKYVYLAIHKSFYPDKYILKYSDIERVDSPESMKHPIFLSAIALLTCLSCGTGEKVAVEYKDYRPLQISSFMAQPELVLLETPSEEARIRDMRIRREQHGQPYPDVRPHREIPQDYGRHLRKI